MLKLFDAATARGRLSAGERRLAQAGLVVSPKVLFRSKRIAVLGETTSATWNWPRGFRVLWSRNSDEPLRASQRRAAFLAGAAARRCSGCSRMRSAKAFTENFLNALAQLDKLAAPAQNGFSDFNDAMKRACARRSSTFATSCAGRPQTCSIC